MKYVLYFVLLITTISCSSAIDVTITASRFSQGIKLTGDSDSDFVTKGYASDSTWSLSKHGSKFCWSYNYKYETDENSFGIQEDTSATGGPIYLYHDKQIIAYSAANFNFLNTGSYFCLFEKVNKQSVDDRLLSEFPGPGSYQIEIHIDNDDDPTYKSPILEVTE